MTNGALALQIAATPSVVMQRAARTAFPREAVGLLAGPQPGTAIEAVTLRNSATDSRQFSVEPWDLFVAEKRVMQMGLQVVGTYHTHPQGTPTLSTEDLRWLSRWDCAHVVIALQDARTASRFETCAYLIQDGLAVRIPLTIN